MKKIECFDWVNKECFEVGGVRDNTVFISCKKEVLDHAYNTLSKQNGEIKAINLKFDKSLLEKIDSALAGFDNEYYKTLFIRDYISSLFMLEFNKQFGVEAERCSNEQMQSSVEAFLSADQQSIIALHPYIPMPSSTINLKSKYGAFEFNVFVEGEPNRLLARAINSFIQMRAPYPVKVYTTEPYLMSNLSLEEQLVEPIHDYRFYQIMDFVKVLEDAEDDESTQKR